MNQIFHKLSFTRNESKVIVFLTILLISALLINYLKGNSEENPASFSFTNRENYRNNNVEQENFSGNSNHTLTENEIRLVNKETAADSLESENKKKKNKKEDKLTGIQININSATKEQLVMLPGIGNSTADKIIMYRENHNGFGKIEDIMKVKGIGKKKFEKLKPYITVN